MTDEKPPRFDESAALAEIERLQEALLVARKARTDKSEEFERFIRSFRTPASPQTSPDDAAAQPAAIVPDDPLPTPVTAPSAAGAVPSRSPHIPARRPWRFGVIAAASVVAIVVITLAIPRHRTGTRSPAPAPVTKPPSAEKPAPPRPSLPQPTGVPEAPAPVQLELRTLAPVWIRVIVDGEKKVEGVIPATQRLSFSGTQSIVVRAGNGGDLLVVSDNREDKFGVPDQALTRTFVPRSDQAPAKH